MRHVICALGTLLCGLLPALQAAELTVVLKFEDRHSARSVAAMRLEAEKQLRDSGVNLEWRNFSQFSRGDTFSKVAVVNLRGRCEMLPLITGSLEPSTSLGLTYRVDGRVIPFSEVKCDDIRYALGTAHLPANPAERDLLYGRALGRVLAHELFHVLHASAAHSKSGVTQKYLSASKLTDDHVD